MTYLLPRALIALIAWGVTCGLIRSLWPSADPMMFYVAGASWAFVTIAYFAYVRKLRREAETHRHRPYSASRSPN